MASNKIASLLSRVEKFNENIYPIIQETIDENEAFICDMNAQQQLFEQGKTTTGVDIWSYAPYSPFTIEIKQSKGQPINRVTLRDEGDFQKSFYIETQSDEFEIKANDWKTEILKRQYGDEIMGLSPENKMEVAWNYVYPKLLTELKTAIYA